MDDLTRLVEEEFQKSAEKIGKKIQSYARRYHRYKHRTGTLRQSTVYQIAKRSVYVTATAEYAPFVIQGHGTWAPDPFLGQAQKRYEQYTIDQLKTVVARAVNRFNRMNKDVKSGNSNSFTK